MMSFGFQMEPVIRVASVGRAVARTMTIIIVDAAKVSLASGEMGMTILLACQVEMTRQLLLNQSLLILPNRALPTLHNLILSLHQRIAVAIG